MLHNAHQSKDEELDEVFKTLGLPGRQKTSLTLAQFYSRTPEPPCEPASTTNGTDSNTTDGKLLDELKHGSNIKPTLHKGIASRTTQPTEISTKADTRASTPIKSSPRQADHPKVLDTTPRPSKKPTKPILTNTSILLKQKTEIKPVKLNDKDNPRTTVQVSSAFFEQFELPRSSTFISKSKLAFLPVHQVTGTPRKVDSRIFRKEKKGLYQPAFVALQRSHLRRQNTLSLPSLNHGPNRSTSMEEHACRDLTKIFSDPACDHQLTWYQPKRHVSILPKAMQRSQQSAFIGVTWKPTPAILNPSTGSVRSHRSRVEPILRSHTRMPGRAIRQSQVIDDISTAKTETKSATPEFQRLPVSSGSPKFGLVQNTPESQPLFQELDPRVPPKSGTPGNPKGVSELSKSVRGSPSIHMSSVSHTPLQNGLPIKPIEDANDSINDD